MGFNTGNNEAKGRKVLRQAFMKLYKHYQCNVLKTWNDRHGVFAKLITVRIAHEVMGNEVMGNIAIQEGQLILVARATRPYKGCVSTQKCVVDYAHLNNHLILLAYCVGDFPYFYAFKPEQIIENNQAINLRLDDDYYNYSIKLGVRVLKEVI